MHNLDITRKPKHRENFNQPETQPADNFFASVSVPAAQPEIARPHIKLELALERQPDFEDRPDFAPAAAEKSADAEKKYSQRQPRFRFLKTFVFTGFMLAVLITGTFIGSRFISFASSVSVSQTSAYQTVSNDVGAVLGNSFSIFKNLDQTGLANAIRGKRRINILLLGYGGGEHSGTYLTDSMLVLNIDFSDNKVALISVPRDTWVQIPTDGDAGSYWKINAAYELGFSDKQYPRKLPEFSGAQGGGNLAKYEVSKIIGMPIDYYLAMDFNGFKTIVDTLGGVDINVDTAFTDYSYPVGDDNVDGDWCVAEDNVQTSCRYKKVHFDAGPQFMNGDRALEYVRSRHALGSEGTDFARSRRQQKLMVAIEGKMLNLSSIAKILELMNDIQGHFQTDLSLAEIKDLSSYISKINIDGAERLSIDDNSLLVAGWSDDGQYILTPKAGLENWGEIQTYIFNSLNVSTSSATTKPAAVGN